MRLETGRFGPRIILSKRNLLALLHKVDWPESRRTIVGPNMDCEVVAEPDNTHYSHPSRGRDVGVSGLMHPDTEAFIKNRP